MTLPGNACGACAEIQQELLLPPSILTTPATDYRTSTYVTD
jgi:hypothetical protein